MSGLTKVLHTAIDNALKNTHTAIPGIVIEFDPEEQRITAQVAINRIVSGVPVKIAPLLDIPIVIPSVGAFHITLPIAVGDECLLIFSERSIDNWFEKGGNQDPIEYRFHDISDGFALIGINSKPNAIQDYNPTDLQIRNDANSQVITLVDNGDIDIVTDQNVNIQVDGDTTIDAGGDVSIVAANNTTIEATALNVDITAGTEIKLDAPLVSVIAPAITMTGDMTYTGTITMTGNLSLDGITVNGHNHVGDSGGETGPMK